MDKKIILLVILIILAILLILLLNNKEGKLSENSEEQFTNLNYDFNTDEQMYEIYDDNNNVLRMVQDESSIKYYIDNPELINE